MRSFSRSSVTSLQKHTYRAQTAELVCTSKLFECIPCRKFSCSTTSIFSKWNFCRPAEITKVDEFEENSPFAFINYQEVTDGDPEKLKKFKLVLLECSMLSYEGYKVPRTLSSAQWIKLLSLDSQGQRKSYLKKLWRDTLKKMSKQFDQEIEHQLLVEKRRAFAEKGRIRIGTGGPIMYNLFCNSLFTRVRNPRIDKYYNYRLFQAARFNPVMVIDCSYESYMSDKSLSACSQQIIDMWSENRQHSNPHHLIFSNLDSAGKLIEKLREKNPAIDKPDYPFFYTSKSYLDLFPREKLVYLTHNASHTLDRYDTSEVYIVGALMYDSNGSIIRASTKKNALRTAKLPLDSYLKWGVANKNLDLDTVLSVINDVKDTGDWKFAFRHVPQSFLQSSEMQEDRLETKASENKPMCIERRRRQHTTYNMLLKELSCK